VRDYLKNSKEIKIIIDLKIGQGQARAWGCDLSYEYININTKYS
jgi:glutamate N-acetyltransferase/amino-acid N-acetyltransferase